MPTALQITTSVVVPVRGNEIHIGRQLEALAVQSCERSWELIIADNGATVATVAAAEALKHRFPSFAVVDASDIAGINHARNVGVEASRGDLVLMADADDEVSPTWIESLTGALDDADGVGGDLDLSILNAADIASGVGPVRLGFMEDDGWLASPAGCNCGFRRTLWDELGGFDETFAGGADEVDFFWRAQLAGYKVERVPEAVVGYRLRTTPKQTFTQYVRWGRGNAQLFKRYGRLGMPSAAARRRLTIRETRKLPAPWTRPGRLLIARVAGWAFGCLIGSVRYRTLYL